MAKERVVQASVKTTEMVTFETDNLDIRALVSVFTRLQSGWRLKRADFVFEKEEFNFPGAEVTLIDRRPKRRR